MRPAASSYAPCRVLLAAGPDAGQERVAGALLCLLDGCAVHTISLPALLTAGAGIVLAYTGRSALRYKCSASCWANSAAAPCATRLTSSALVTRPYIHALAVAVKLNDAVSRMSTP